MREVDIRAVGVTETVGATVSTVKLPVLPPLPGLPLFSVQLPAVTFTTALLKWVSALAVKVGGVMGAVDLDQVA